MHWKETIIFWKYYFYFSFASSRNINLIVFKLIIEKDDHFYINKTSQITIIFIISSINDFKFININKIMLKRHPITACTKILCVIGHPIEHSMSPIMHNAIIQDLGLDFAYVAFDVRPENLKGAVEGFRALNVIGINVTIPHKETIINYLDTMDDVAQNIGAVNTIKNDNGNLIGRNTDAEGGRKALIDADCQISGKNLMILGAGGAAKALCYSLAKNTNKIVIVNRTEERAVKLAEEVGEKFGVNIEGKNNSKRSLKDDLKKVDVLINTTPIGMYPNVDNTPVPKEFLHPELYIFDVIYNPLETKLVKDGKEIGCKTLGGLDMLVNQGALAFEWWTNKKPNINLMKKKIIEFLNLK